MCSGTTFNPCKIGKCSNSGNGGYNCTCPVGFFEDRSAEDTVSCTSGNYLLDFILLQFFCDDFCSILPEVEYNLNSESNYLTTTSGEDCNYVSQTTGLGLKTLLFINEVKNSPLLSVLYQILMRKTLNRTFHAMIFATKTSSLVHQLTLLQLPVECSISCLQRQVILCFPMFILGLIELLCLHHHRQTLARQ